MRSGIIITIQSIRNCGVSPSMGMNEVHWWDKLMNGMNENITWDRHLLQLMHLSRELKDELPEYKQRQSKVVLQHENAQPHVSKPVKYRKHSKGISYTIHSILQTLLLLTTTCFDQCFKVCLNNTSGFYEECKQMCWILDCL